ncbi:hypothetical protein [Leptolyngbya sp. 'hensonii']|uniref:hypothetical protein n=1 Tax=Leptolyngbya sp. 'hensonii' TaxID=1922337 RepID=UPI000A8A5A53|nr:hypothetical protein [Leptolyngbya sp. 'hensonii']
MKYLYPKVSLLVAVLLLAAMGGYGLPQSSVPENPSMSPLKLQVQKFLVLSNFSL